MNGMQSTVVLKIILALVCISALVSLPMRQSSGEWAFLQAAGIVLLVFIVTSGVAVATASVNQVVLKEGGTDPQWLAFPSDPPGLEKLREEARESLQVAAGERTSACNGGRPNPAGPTIGRHPGIT